METTRYAVVDTDDTKINDHEKFDDAKAEAQAAGDCAVIQETYEYTDSKVSWTPDGSDTWPPESHDS